MVDKTAFDYVNEIWGIANYVRDVIRSADYNKLILPFAVLRRFECALEPTRGAVCKRVAKGTWADDVFLVKSVFRVSSLIFFGFRHEECRPVVCFTGCPSCRT
ncbi:type I restriction-modification system subunit M N-terminal domain-containing protein [Bifidobacterium longum]|uniref:type I restriction-modification system subunit M N-terminal domain-containing protein n=1 Tax=Bifidobacterium longum TaxID=216816 RepID=UPI001F36E6A3|nr:type I restriction-modification system subunit M N-terminal domain-containing protein [Bifidobacterium longum]